MMVTCINLINYTVEIPSNCWLPHRDNTQPRPVFSELIFEIPFSTHSMLFHLEYIADSHTTEVDDEVTYLKHGPPALSFLLLLLVDVGKHEHQ